MKSMSPSGQLVGALAPAKLRKDGIRLGLVGALSIISALVLEQQLLDVVLIALNGFGVAVATLALVVACFALRRHGGAALLAVAVYGTCLAGHLTAMLLLLG